MPRRRRYQMNGHVYHVLNRAARRARIFGTASDYKTFENVLEKTVLLHRPSIAIFAYCLMPNHWHLVASPTAPGALSVFMHRLTTTHARQWHHSKGSAGQGAVYQGRFAAIPIQCDRHFLIVCRYVERNALRASLVSRAEDWPWCSLWRRTYETSAWLADWPVERPSTWIREVNTHQTPAELEALRKATRRGHPFGDEEWREEVWPRLSPNRSASQPHTRPQMRQITNT
jgi:putative transposase